MNPSVNIISQCHLNEKVFKEIKKREIAKSISHYLL